MAMRPESLAAAGRRLTQVNGNCQGLRHDAVDMTTSVTCNVLRNRSLEGPTASERAVLERAVSEVRELPGGHIAVRQGEPISVSTLLVEGFMTRHVDAADGRRHLVALHVPGDFVDLHAYALKRLDHDVGTLGKVTVAIVPHSELDKIEAEHRELTKRLWFLTVLDAALHRQWVYRVASLSAIQRVAHLLCEIHARLLAIGEVSSGQFELPMTQVDIGEVCSLTNVHVNRVVRQLREQGLCEVRSGRVDIHDLHALAALGRFRPDYLYLNERTASMAGGEAEGSR